MITTLHKLSFCLCFAVLSFTSCSGQSLDLVSGDNRNQAAASENSVEKLFTLDLNKPSIVQPIDANQKAPEAAKFVKVEVVGVTNPRQLPISFQVHYQTQTNEKLYLGSFGLYPSDRPGKFIVATQGKLKNEGAIVLTLVRPESAGADDTIKVTVKKIYLVNE